MRKIKYKIRGGVILLENATSRIDPVKMASIAIWVFVGVCLGILGCYLLIN